MNTQIERKIPSKITPSPAVLAATLGAMASAASAGHDINVESKNIDFDEQFESIKATLANNQFTRDVQKNYEFDFSVFNNHLFIDEKETIVSEDLLMLIAGLGNKVDADTVDGCEDNPGVCWNSNCYTNCHVNCHGSRSWR